MIVLSRIDGGIMILNLGVGRGESSSSLDRTISYGCWFKYIPISALSESRCSCARTILRRAPSKEEDIGLAPCSDSLKMDGRQQVKVSRFRSRFMTPELDGRKQFTLDV